MSKRVTFINDVSFLREDFLNDLQEILTPWTGGFRLEHTSGATIRATVDSVPGVAGIIANGKHRFVTTSPTVVVSGGAGSRNIYAIAGADSGGDPQVNTNRTWTLEAATAGAAGTNSRLIGTASYNGSGTVSNIRLTAGQQPPADLYNAFIVRPNDVGGVPLSVRGLAGQAVNLFQAGIDATADNRMSLNKDGKLTLPVDGTTGGLEIGSFGTIYSDTAGSWNGITIAEKLHVTGAVDFDSTLNVDGTVNIEGATTVDDNLSVIGNISVVGITATGLVTADDLTVADDLAAADATFTTLTVNTDVSIAGNITTALKIPSGAIGTPAVRFTADTDTGISLISSEMVFGHSGVNMMAIGASGINTAKPWTFNNGGTIAMLASATTPVFGVKRVADAQLRLMISTDGQLSWGPAGDIADVFVFRMEFGGQPWVGATRLYSTDEVIAGSTLTIGSVNAPFSGYNFNISDTLVFNGTGFRQLSGTFTGNVAPGQGFVFQDHNAGSNHNMVCRGTFQYGAIAPISDVKLKTDLRTPEDALINSFLSLPIKKWKWRDGGPDQYWHLGPMAQDFNELFNPDAMEKAQEIRMDPKALKDRAPMPLPDEAYNMGDLVGVMALTIQKLAQRVDALEKSQPQTRRLFR